MILNARSEKNLEGVNPDLVRVVRRAAELTNTDFIVTEGRRTHSRQQQLFNEGKSRTLNSRHLTGHAVDLAANPGGAVSWDMKFYALLSVAMKAAAEEQGVPIVWGGDWISFKDGPHFELDRKVHP